MLTLHGGAAPVATQQPIEALVLNSAIGGVTAGLVSHARGRPFWKALLGGAIGGATAYGGKLIVAERDDLGFLGRELVLVGSSITRNSMLGVGLLDTLTVAIGPVKVDIAPRAPGVPNVRLDVFEVGWIVYAMTRDTYSFDARRSLRSGAIVFTTREGLGFDDRGVVYARTYPGVIVAEEAFLAASPRTFAHELIHVVQIDQLGTIVGIPLEHAALDALGWRDAPPFRYLQLGVAHFPAVLLLSGLLEREADGFEAR